MGHRRKAREFAMQALYMYETVGTPVDELTRLDWVDKEIPEDIMDFALNLITGTIANIDCIDNLIKQYSRNWKFERINPVDKSILRISVYALLYCDGIPHAVTIDEGIELGKIYGSENSGQFINGILDAIRIHEGEKK
ncbi:MAG TPA: transcription antitermination factor NusB [Spirochaetota bacterium]|nr:transcription antitermination factor NusB [Spirochaetota bacterium]HOM87452.1 transcription antitermination factor NusB [Spirochaetota bacterium]HPD05019.1 transcription antitermination factor NusB [Spirochaetota bacterium]HQG43217.1 transcription antitermination factor NusB [Spirochaetota bacterium]HQI39025.1 transcription antitermination factor NusB [Spirochaetota bacterium]